MLTLVGTAVVMPEPDRLTQGVTSGLAFLPVTGDSRWLTPLALTTYGLAALFLLRQATARTPLIGWRQWPALARDTDIGGALLLTTGLGAVILTFASAEPESAAISDQAPWLVPIAIAAFAGFAMRQRRAARPADPARRTGRHGPPGEPSSCRSSSALP